MSGELIQLSGVLLHDAEVRTKHLGDDQTPTPVLVLVIKSDGTSTVPVCAEQVYPAGMRDEAVATAKTMKKGKRVTVWAPLAQLRYTLAYTQRIDVHGRAKPTKSTTNQEAVHG
ncbi:hypothetical protein GCM10010975_26810 [Comamonas phosphati]|nr:hypothetical protein GCM10010975_26810 [Comamonas phosphati]